MAEFTDDITSFLPKYPNVVPYENNMLNPYNGTFYDSIYRKKEFYELRLSITEDVPEEPGDLMNHQKIIARYLSSHTPYNGVLLFHEMGTGKTCSAVAAIEQIKSEGKFRGAIYIASVTLSNNFLNELINVCTDGRYIPEDLGDTDRTGKIRMKKAVSEYYKLGSDYTYDKFAKNVGSLPLEEVRRRYNNHIIIIDEVHNLADNNKDGASYKRIWDFLHQVQGCKVLLLSGTPMRNRVWDIASVMNLILPASNQLETGEEFVRKYCDRVDKDLDLVTAEGATLLKEYFKGRVSYLRGITSDVDRVFHGKFIVVPGIKQEPGFFKIDKCTMSAFQTEAYLQAWDKDKSETKSSKNKGSGYYRNSRQASLFVFPDGSWGTTGFNKYIQVGKTSTANILGRKKKSAPTWKKPYANDLVKDIKSRGVDALEKYSCKYAASCRILFKAIEDKKLVFIYNESVSEGGVILFSLILKLLGFVESTGGTKREGVNTFAVLTGSTANKLDIIRNFNRPDNREGGRINLIIGSQAVSEGLTLKNVQVEIVQTAWFNYARIDQALARGYRAGSHTVLSRYKDDITQDIYLQAAVPNNSEYISIDDQMYTVAQKKDISFKRVESVMRSAAFDCALTYKRNQVIAKPGSRECNYSNCDYKCDGVPELQYKSDNPVDIDYSTYNLYYSHDKIQQLVAEITALFRTNFRLSFSRISEMTSANNEFELTTALYTITTNSIPIYNRYGFVSYLQEENDTYFLVDGLSTIGSANMAYYTKYPNVKIKQTFDMIKTRYFDDIALPRAVQDICVVKGNIRPYIERLPLKYKEVLLEDALRAEVLRSRGRKFQETEIDIASRILKYFESSIRRVGESSTVISTLLYTRLGILRCLDTGGTSMDLSSLTWKDCNDEEEEQFLEDKLANRQKMEKEPFYGQIHPTIKERFCIRDCRDGKCEETLGHKVTSGAQCTSYQVEMLALITTFYTDLEVPPTQAAVNDVLAAKCTGNLKRADPQKLPLVDDNIVIGKLKIPYNNKRALTEFLVKGVEDVETFVTTRKDNINPKVIKKWWSKDTELRRYVVQLGGGSKFTWDALKKGIRAMTLNQMQRLVYYGTKQKNLACGFLCHWFTTKGLILVDTGCGESNKKKPRAGKSTTTKKKSNKKKKG